MITVLCMITCTLSLYCCEPHAQVTEIVELGQPTAAVIFLHGVGGNGPIMKDMVERLGDFSKYSNLRIIFPTAPPKAFSPFPWNGQILNSWYDIDRLAIDAVENVTDIEESALIIETLINEQVASGIPRNKICVVGYSVGANMALHSYEYIKDIACVGSLFGYLSTASNLYKELSTRENVEGLPPLYLSAGRLDFIVLPHWTLSTMEVFKSAGVSVKLYFQWTATHFLTSSDVQELFKFVQHHVS